MSSHTVITATATIVGDAYPLAAGALAPLLAEIDSVVQLVELGIVGVPEPGASPDDWRFHSADLQSALEVRRLERDFGVGLDAAALILDLQNEVRRLKAVLQAEGVRRS